MLASAATFALLPERFKEAILLTMIGDGVAERTRDRSKQHHSVSTVDSGGLPASVETPKPIITISAIPTKRGGWIAGSAKNLTSGDLRVVVYALTDHWYVQPDLHTALTPLHTDGSWGLQTRAGVEYVVLLVDRSYSPVKEIDAAPTGGVNVLASAQAEAKKDQGGRL
jgi:hypothetical protein